jgi:hypothetical protein
VGSTSVWFGAVVVDILEEAPVVSSGWAKANVAVDADSLE